jgi:hypothetical protein
MQVGSSQQSPSLFQRSHGDPEESTNTAGSIAPPSSSGQMKADAELSTNGPVGLPAVAREMHSAFVHAFTVCTQP